MKFIIIICLFYSFIAKTQNNIIPFKKDNLYGFMDMDTQVVISNKYIYIAPFAKNGLAKVMEPGGKFGFINAQGNYVLKPQYSLASSFNDQGFAFIYDDNRYKIMNKDGEIHLVLPEEIAYINYEETNSMGFVAAEKGVLGEGFFSWSGKIIIPTIKDYRNISFLDTNIILNTITALNDPYSTSYKVIDLTDSTKTWNNYIFRESFENGKITNTAFNNTTKKIDTFDYNLQVRTQRYYQKDKTISELKNCNTANIYLKPHSFKSFGILYTVPFKTFISEETLTDIKIEEDNLYLYPNKNWKSVLQFNNLSISLNIEYYYKNDWISPYSIYPYYHGCFSKKTEFWKPKNQTGIKIKKPVLNQGDIEITTRFSLEVITHANDTTKIYSQPFMSKTYSGHLEHPRPFELDGMIRF